MEATIEFHEIVENVSISFEEITESISVEITETIEVTEIVFEELGVRGLTGKSTYQIAVDNGFTGTQTEWLESQKNIDGGLIF
jgi:hypothetical protein